MGKHTQLTAIATLLLIIALMASNLIAVQALTIDDIPKPLTPEFTVKIVAHPYDVPPKTTTTIDQYTGKETTTTQPGYHVENKSIEITIKNQPSPLSPLPNTQATIPKLEKVIPMTATALLTYTTISALKDTMEMTGKESEAILQTTKASDLTLN